MDAIKSAEDNQYLNSSNSIRGPIVGERAESSLINASWFQEGLEDAARGVYDKHSFHPDRPLRADTMTEPQLEKELAATLQQQVKDEYAAMDIVIRTKAASTEANAAYASQKKEADKLSAKVEERLRPMEDPGSHQYVPDAHLQTDPHVEQPKKSWWRSVVTKRNIIIAIIVIAEVVVGLWAFFALNEGTLVTFALAAVIALTSVLIPIYAAKILREDGPTGGPRKIWVLVAFVALVAVVVGAGALRYVAMKEKISVTTSTATTHDGKGGLILPQDAETQTATEQGRVPAANGVEPWVLLTLLILNMGLPLSLSMVLLLIELGDRSGAVAEVRHLRMRHTAMNEQLPRLEGLCLHAQHAATVAEHNLVMVPELTKACITGLPALVEQHYLAYISGLSRGLADPSITAQLDECAAAFHIRFASTADKLVEECLDRVRQPVQLPEPAQHRVDAHGNAFKIQMGGDDA